MAFEFAVNEPLKQRRNSWKYNSKHVSHILHHGVRNFWILETYLPPL